MAGTYTFDGSAGVSFDNELYCFDCRDWDLFDAGAIPSEEVFGPLAAEHHLAVTSITTTEAFGTGQLNHHLFAPSIASSESFGDLEIKDFWGYELAVTGIWTPDNSSSDIWTSDASGETTWA